MIEATNQNKTSESEQVIATPRATELIQRLTAKYGPIVFLQSTDCCGGGSPMCGLQSSFQEDESDVLLGTLHGAPFYLTENQFEGWQRSQITLDVAPGIGGVGSLENGEGARFVIRGHVFTNDEIASLRAAGKI